MSGQSPAAIHLQILLDRERQKVAELESHCAVLLERDEKYTNTITGLHHENLELRDEVEALEHKLQRILGTQEDENIPSCDEALAKIYLICEEQGE